MKKLSNDLLNCTKISDLEKLIHTTIKPGKGYPANTAYCVLKDADTVLFPQVGKKCNLSNLLIKTGLDHHGNPLLLICEYDSTGTDDNVYLRVFWGKYYDTLSYVRAQFTSNSFFTTIDGNIQAYYPHYEPIKGHSELCFLDIIAKDISMTRRGMGSFLVQTLLKEIIPYLNTHHRPINDPIKYVLVNAVPYGILQNALTQQDRIHFYEKNGFILLGNKGIYEI
ncbi:hypothetical protein [Niameybacter massiliensis]|uniref:hypothetical protein n=1 Tax=Niameybacter massiliensis TaxID=1658108 RepID=UPI0006B580F0|nr:hypothetical protein [Niameybacter massiliensis]